MDRKSVLGRIGMLPTAVRWGLFQVVLLCSVSACGGRSGLFVDAREAGARADAGSDACGPSTCAGCCDEEGTCRSGTETAACGVQGMQCQACDPRFDVCNPNGGGTHERGLVCWSPCDKSCGGCCLTDGTCLQGTADDACGSSTMICDDCAAEGLVCGQKGRTRGCVPG